jgi:SAM-dependent methyltransferase
VRQSEADLDDPAAERFARLFERFWSHGVPPPSSPEPNMTEAAILSRPQPAPAAPPPSDEAKLEALAGRLVAEASASATAPLVLLGDRLGLYKALAAEGPCSSSQLAAATGTLERYVREWLAAQAAAGYIDYDPATGRFSLSPEQALVFAEDDSPASFVGVFYTLASMFIDLEKTEAAFRSGRGVGWHEHHPHLFCGVERFFRSGYLAHLVNDWLPALDGVVDKLNAGITVADIGCGHGASTIIMAKAFPNSRFIGFDYHEESIERARAAAGRAGVADRVRFEVASAKETPGSGYGLVTVFDALHDMGDPVGAAQHLRSVLAPDGTWMIVEPFAGDRLEDNLNPVGRIFYACSTLICTPGSLAQEVGLGLGAQAGERRLREVLTEAGFTRVRRAVDTPFNMVLEARP